MRTQRLTAWPPIAPAQVPGFPMPWQGDWQQRNLRLLGESLRYWPTAPASPRFGLYDPAQAVISINGVRVR